MLQGKLKRASALAVLAATALVACGDDDGGGGAIEDNVVRPGITAMEQASSLACGADGETLRVAVESYTALEGEPPADEAALVEKSYLREESELWDVVDGELVAAVPDCGAAGTITPPVTDVGEIVTSTEPASTDSVMSAEDMLATLTEDQIAEVGGVECARELAELAAAGSRFAAERGAEPQSIDDVVEAGYLDGQPELWVLDGDDLQPAPGSPCVVPGAIDGSQACLSEAKTLEVAIEAYYARYGRYPTSESELVDVEFIREEFSGVDLDGETVVAAPDGPCVDADLG